MLDHLSKTQLISRGWTADKLRERIVGCREGIKEIKNNSASFSYRYIYISLYEQYKRALATLLKQKNGNPIPS